MERERFGPMVLVLDLMCALFRVFWNFSTVTYRRENKFDQNSSSRGSFFSEKKKKKNFDFFDNKICCFFTVTDPEPVKGDSRRNSDRDRQEFESMIRPWVVM